MRSFWLIALALFVWAAPASAGRIAVTAASTQTLYSGYQTCAVVVNDAATADYSFVTRDCDDTIPESFGLSFLWPSDAPTTGTVTVSIEVHDKTGPGGDACYEVVIGCAVTNTEALTFGSSESASATLTSATYTVMAFAATGVPVGVASGDYCVLGIFRRPDEPGGCSDTLTGDTQIRDVIISY